MGQSARWLSMRLYRTGCRLIKFADRLKWVGR